MLMSSAASRPNAAVVSTSAGRRLGASATSPATSDRAAPSESDASARSSSRSRLCPRVDSPGAQHMACAPSTPRSAPHREQAPQATKTGAPTRKRTATRNSSGKSAVRPPPSSHSHPWSVPGARKSRRSASPATSRRPSPRQPKGCTRRKTRRGRPFWRVGSSLRLLNGLSLCACAA